ncbi:MAG: hypothetical protein IJF67_13390, partial [Clostridia bacterium]|nr:hypothetical protein [Clostridia bacterium]
MIRIDTAVKAKQHNFWNNIHFHPTDAIEDAWGQRYLDAVAEAGIAHTVRMYTMFEDMVTMDEAGKLVFDFTENDTRMDYMVARGFNLLVCYNFIPPCIAEYNDKTNTEVRVSTRYKGKTLCTMPPRDFALWEEVCRVYTAHIVERYGLERVKNWYLQCYNEPDVRGFFMAPLGTGDEAFHKRMEVYGALYAAFVRGTTAVSEALKIGGPAASNGRAFELWLKYIKEHDLRADFACAHSYGTNPQNINSGKRDIGADYNITIIQGYLDRLAKYYPEMEFVMDEGYKGTVVDTDDTWFDFEHGTFTQLDDVLVTYADGVEIYDFDGDETELTKGDTVIYLVNDYNKGEVATHIWILSHNSGTVVGPDGGDSDLSIVNKDGQYIRMAVSNILSDADAAKLTVDVYALGGGLLDDDVAMHSAWTEVGTTNVYEG